MLQKKISRYGFIDAIRGVAACAVMLQHSLYQSGLLGNYPSERLIGFIPSWLELGETGVVAFFLVSGFVIPLSLEKTADFTLFWIHRVLRIYPLYLTVFVLNLLLSAGGGLDSPVLLVTNIFAHLAFIQEYVHQRNFVGGSWTLSLEMVWYIVISGLFLLSMNRRVGLLVGCGLAASGLSWGLCALGHHVPMGRLSMLLCCVAGLIFYRYEQAEISALDFYRLLAILGFVILLNLAVGDAIFPANHPTSSFRMVLVSWSFAGMLFSVPFATRTAALWRHPGLAFLGRISYSIYLLHPVALFLLALVPLRGVSLITCTFLATIAASTITYRIIELPPIRFGHRFRFSRKGIVPRLSP